MKCRALACVLIVCTILTSNAACIKAENNKTLNNTVDKQLNIDTKEVLQEQLEKLYKEISDSVGIDIKYVKIIHKLSGAELVYESKIPNIYTDETLHINNGPMYIEGANTSYERFNECEQDKERDSRYYLPDALYSVTKDIYALMTQRYFYNRGDSQEYFNTLTNDVRTSIIFYEAVLTYIETDKDIVDNVINYYKQLIYNKKENENISKQYKDGSILIKDKFKTILKENGLKDTNEINILSIMLSYDNILATSDSMDSAEKDFILPYEPNLKTRENMMLAAASLAGKVRYIWGGGHTGGSYINGINPLWKEFNNNYTDSHYKTCIKPSGSWCPIHGYVSGSYHGKSVASVSDYKRYYSSYTDSKIKGSNILNNIRYTGNINAHTLDGLDCSGFASWLYNQITDDTQFNSVAVAFSNQSGLNKLEYDTELLPGDTFGWQGHIIVIVGKVKEGSKVYTTVEQTPNVLKYGVGYYSGASSSDIQYAMQVAREANQLIGGIDSEHEKPHCYCLSTVGIRTVKDTKTKTFTKSTSEKVFYPDQAIESDKLISILEKLDIDTTDMVYETEIDDYDEDGNIVGTHVESKVDYEPTDYIPDEYDRKEKKYVDDGYYITYYKDKKIKKEITTEKKVQTATVGRLKTDFIDENTVIPEYNKKFKDLTSVEIIQHTITKLPLSYISGYKEYKNNIFNKGEASKDEVLYIN